MEKRTELKEKRNEILVLVYIGILFISGASILFYEKEKSLCIVLGVQFLLLLYRVLTYCFNYSLLFVFRGEKFKIDRLKGRVTPIYKIYKDWDELFCVEKFSVHYTKLGLQWCIPFSVLFEEQEYISDGKFYFNTAPDEIVGAWELEESSRNLKLALEVAEKVKKQQKLNKLNKVFNENYK